MQSDKQFVWDGLDIAEERNAANSVSQRFFSQGEQDGVTVLLYRRDHLGSVQEADSTSGALQARYDYDLWGRRTKVTGTFDADMGYTGHPYHSASGLSLAPCRAYAAELGRWISRDPLNEEGGQNLYGYVLNCPIAWSDAFGLAADIDLHSPGDPADSVRDQLPESPDTITIFAHGNPDFIDDERSIYPGQPARPVKPLYAKDIAKMIKNHPKFKKAKLIILYSCDTGKGRNPVAKKVAKEVGLPVLAPDQPFWTSPAQKNGISGVFPSDSAGQPIKSQPGSFRRFP